MTRRGAKQKYIEGDWGAVPLVGGGYALGVIARTTKKSPSTLFGYFSDRNERRFRRSRMPRVCDGKMLSGRVCSAMSVSATVAG
jgi:hypothetical protein